MRGEPGHPGPPRTCTFSWTWSGPGRWHGGGRWSAPTPRIWLRCPGTRSPRPWTKPSTASKCITCGCRKPVRPGQMAWSRVQVPGGQVLVCPEMG